MARKKWAGARWYIGTKTAALASETNWTEIEGARAASGSFGKEWQTTDATTLADHFRRNAKTIFDAGQIELTMLRNMADPGQAALRSACNDKTDDPFNFTGCACLSFLPPDVWGNGALQFKALAG